MIEGIRNVTVTPETLAQYRVSHGDWVKIGHTIPERVPADFDMRLFGQLRTYLGFPPGPKDHL